MTLDLNTSPYFDDYDQDKQFYRILFRPGIAVQARELTQLQTILQEQANRIGIHLFKEGAMIVPGHIAFDRRFTWVKVVNNEFTDTEEAIENNFLNKTIVGASTSLEAQVIHYTPKDTNNIVYLFVKYQKGNVSDGVNLTAFEDGESLSVLDAPSIAVDVDATDATGTGCGATIEQGIYFTKGFFAIVEKQIVVIDVDNPNPSSRIGLDVQQTIVTPEDDETLLSNATGSPNYAAPGAHRLKIELILTTKDLSTVGDANVNDNFIELLRLVDGRAELKVDNTAYGILEKTLARRTFDESGDYTVRPFLVSIKEFYNENDNGGVYTKENLFEPTSLLADQVARQRFGMIEGDEESPQTFAHHDESYGANKYLPGRTLEEFEAAARKKAVIAVDPGKAYVRGYEIETLSTNFIDLDKARDFLSVNNAIVRTSAGNFVRITNVEGLPRLSTGVGGEESFQKIDLYDRRKSDMDAAIIGSARGRYMDFVGGTPLTSSATYSLSLFDIQMNDGKIFEHVMSMKSVPADGMFNFSADTFLVLEPFIGGLITTAGDGVVTGQNVYWATSDEQRIVTDDVLMTSEGDFIYVAQIPVNNTQLIIKNTPTFSDVGVYRAYAKLEDVANIPMLFRTPQAFTKHLTSDTSFVVQKQFLTDAVSGSHDVTITTSDSTESFASFSYNDYIVVNADDGAFVPLTQANVSFPPANQITFTFSDNSYDGDQLVVLASVIKTQHPSSQHKTKTYITGIFGSAAVSGSGVQDLKRFYLGKTDIVKISAIYMSPDFTTSPTSLDTDITSRYDLDNGQRDTHYDHGSIILKKGSRKPTGRIAVVFDYFQHSHDALKTYFSVDSYSVDYSEIPTYTSSEIGQDFPLSDCLDFRPTKEQVSPSITYTDADFIDGTGSITYVPKGIISIDFEYYLNRRDKFYLNQNGNFYVVKGTPGINPVTPQEPSDGMVLYDLQLRAYTKNTKEIFPTYRENKRYTMRDIGKLDDRLKKVEYYTSLTLLEKDTSDLDIKDADGNDRFKNGFIVDPFKGHGIGDVLNPDYTCAMDIQSGELRPQFYEDNVSLIEATGADGFGTVTDFTRITAEYTKKGDLILLPYSDSSMISQKAASKTLNVNPYAVFSFLGAIDLSPPSDDWKDTVTKPELKVYDNSALESLQNLVAPDALGTIWNEWEFNWAGTTQKGQPEVIDQTLERFPGVAVHLTQDGRVDLDANGDASWNPAGNILLQQTRKQATSSLRSSQSKNNSRPNNTSRNGGSRVTNNNPNTTQNINTNANPNQQKTTNGPLNFPVRVNQTLRTTYETEIQQTRSGYNLQVSAGKEINNDLGERVVDVSFAPYIRSKDLVFTAKGFKPNTRLFAFFDNQPVSIYCSAGSTYNSAQTIDDADFSLITNDSGTVTGTFHIPNPDTDGTGVSRFLTGERQFKLTDRAENDDNWTTQGAVTYRAQGLQQTKQNTILSTRVAEFDRVTQIDPNPKSITFETFDTNVKDGTWVDPLAQSILCNSKGGAFLTKVNLFFASKAANLPVILQVREMVNGYPGQRILPFGEVILNPENVHTNVISGNHAPTPDDSTDTVGTLTIDDSTTLSNFSTADFEPTEFEFSSPVYLMEGTEYCMVVMANTQEYTMYVSELGERNAGTRIPITNQPYAGSLFKSQNASTWSADQNQDMMFEIFQAEFDTSKTGTLLLTNSFVPMALLDNNPFTVQQDSGVIKVLHQNHGFRNKLEGFINPPRIQFTGVETFGGIDSSNINNDIEDPSDFHEITIIDLDSYYFTIDTLATSSTTGGGDSVYASEDKQMEVAMPNITDIVLPNTAISYQIKTTSGTSVHDLDELFQPYVLETLFNNFVPNKNIEFETPRMICAHVNEVDEGDGPVLSSPPTTGSKSLFVQASLTSTNPNISPVIDLSKTSITCVASRLNNPAPTGLGNINVDPIDIEEPTLNTLGSTVTSIGTALTGTGFDTDLHGREEGLYEGASIVVSSGPNAGQRRIITEVTNSTTAVLDRAFDPDLSAPTTVKTSASTNVAFGTSLEDLVSSISAVEFHQDQNYIEVADPTNASSLSSLIVTDYIVISDTSENNGTFRISKILYSSAGIFIYVEESLADETPGATTIQKVADSILCSDGTQSLSLSRARVGQFIDVNGSLEGDGVNNGTYRIQKIVYTDPNIEIFVDANFVKEEEGTPITLRLLESFFAEEASVGGSAASSYVTRRMVLNAPSTALQIRYAANIDSSADVRIYYKISRADDNTPFDEIPYSETFPDAFIDKAMNDSTFKEYQHTVNGLPPFLSVAIKIVMLGGDPTRVPRLKDLSVIALDA